jgi:hypothetical protein
MSGNGKIRRETSAQTAENFFRLRRNRRRAYHPHIACCPRFVWGDGTHDLSCEKFEHKK